MKPAHLTPPGQPSALPSDNGSERARHALEQFWLGQQQYNGEKNHNDATNTAPHRTPGSQACTASR
ncbi:Transcriptional regulator [Pseudomonas chlororaphis]